MQDSFLTEKTPAPIKDTVPLAHRARPKELRYYRGQEQILTRYPFLREGRLICMILWGPPGSGKTTLAHILAGGELYTFNAATDSTVQLKRLISGIAEVGNHFKKTPVVLIDEIHRLTKPQQDILLASIEVGDFILIGATTENPKAVINKSLLSRLQIIELSKLNEENIFDILTQTAEKFSIKVSDDVLEYVAKHAGGDARTALNALEAVENSESMTIESLHEHLFANNRDYDKDKDRHYDVISAFIKSMRGSDPNAALLWLAVMIDGGEDPVFIARRLLVFASEDVGNADPAGIRLAVAITEAVEKVGMPEARIHLAHLTTYLASTVKSNAAYIGIEEALEYVRQKDTIEVPKHLKNHGDNKSKYLYPHDYPKNFVKQSYTIESIPKFYRPGNEGIEQRIKKRLETLLD